MIWYTKWLEHNPDCANLRQAQTFGVVLRHLRKNSIVLIEQYGIERFRLMSFHHKQHPNAKTNHEESSQTALISNLWTTVTIDHNTCRFAPTTPVHCVLVCVRGPWIPQRSVDIPIESGGGIFLGNHVHIDIGFLIYVFNLACRFVESLLLICDFCLIERLCCREEHIMAMAGIWTFVWFV